MLFGDAYLVCRGGHAVHGGVAGVQANQQVEYRYVQPANSGPISVIDTTRAVAVVSWASPDKDGASCVFLPCGLLFHELHVEYGGVPVPAVPITLLPLFLLGDPDVPAGRDLALPDGWHIERDNCPKSFIPDNGFPFQGDLLADSSC